MSKKEKNEKQHFFQSLKAKLFFLKYLDPFYYVDIYILPKINKDKNEIVTFSVYLITAFFSAALFYFILGLLLNTTAPLVVVVSGSMEPTLYRGDVLIVQGIPAKDLKAQTLELSYPTLQGIRLTDISQTICEDMKGNINDCEYFKRLYALKLLNLNDFVTKKIVFADGKEFLLDKEGDIIVYQLIEKNIPVIHRIVLKLKAQDGYYFLTKGDSIKNPVIDQDSALSHYPLHEKMVVGKAIFRIPLIGYIKLLLVDDVLVLLFGCPQGMECPFP